MSYKNLYKHYENCFDKYGDSNLGVDWPNKEDAFRRYKIMLSIIKDYSKPIKLLDFGCGCGHLLEYIQEHDLNIDYYGLDISKKFYDCCISKFPNNTFYNIDILKEDIDILPDFDYIILNGVFTEKRNLNDEEMFDFFSNILKMINKKTKTGIAFNVMSPIVDFKRKDLFYLSFDKLGFF